MKNSLLVLLLSPFIIIACSTSPSKNAQQLHLSNKAMLYGENQSDNLTSWINPIGSYHDINFCAHNGKDLFTVMSGCPNELILEPGTHSIEARCFVFFQNATAVHPHKYDSFVVEAGHIYKFKATHNQYSCKITIEDSTNSKANKSSKPTTKSMST